MQPTKTIIPGQIPHKNELATKAAHSDSPEIRRLAEAALFYARRSLPGDGRMCRQYRRAIRAEAHAELGHEAARNLFLDL